MPAMTNMQFRFWINPLKGEYSKNTISEKFYCPNTGRFSRLDWIKTFMLNPQWMFNAKEVPPEFRTEEFKHRLISWMVKRRTDTLVALYVSEREDYSNPTKDYLDKFFPEFKVLLV